MDGIDLPNKIGWKSWFNLSNAELACRQSGSNIFIFIFVLLTFVFLKFVK